jgi:prepilin-type N-terminal cleavage/methylation domain-containing protein
MKINCTEGGKTRGSSGFTLIELLTVMAIIGILAGLVLAGMSIGTSKARISRAQAELASLDAAIAKFQLKKGYYPPDNSNTNNVLVTTNGVIPIYDYQNSLLYELTGCTTGTGGTSFTNIITGQPLDTASIQPLFNVGGFLNSSTDPTQLVNYYPGLKSTQYSTVPGTNAGNFIANFTVLGIAVPGPHMLSNVPNKPGAGIINPFHYNVSSPVHNPGKYDLWVDVIYSGHTNRISNWSNDPQPL